MGLLETYLPQFSAKVILHSINIAEEELLTMELTYPRFIHAEVMTYRRFCLAGDTKLEFELPGKNHKGKRSPYVLSLQTFAEKWLHGVPRGIAKRKKPCDLSWIVPETVYPAREASLRLGLGNPSNIHKHCREGTISAKKEGTTWMILGKDLIAWRNTVVTDTTFDAKTRLSQMNIRQLNEDTGDIQTSRVLNVFESGTKEVWEVQAGKYKVAGSKDHRILTATGWRTIGQLRKGDSLVVRTRTKPKDLKADPLRLKKIEGRWRSTWQNQQRALLQKENPKCRKCLIHPGIEIHHITAVHENINRAFDPTNITLLCDACHQEKHKTQGWQEGVPLYSGLATIDSIRYRGVEPTYDLEIAGAFPNFLANGVVVHNSRNAASSRALPFSKLRKQVEETPAVPVYWGKHQPGMQAAEELSLDPGTPEKGVSYPPGEPCSPREQAMRRWLKARDMMLVAHRELEQLGAHKQITNRILEPWMNITIIMTGNREAYEHLFFERCHPAAQPEFQALANKMRTAVRESVPTLREPGEWHLPYTMPEELKLLGLDMCKKISTARCARVSYLTHEGVRDCSKDVALAEELLSHTGDDPGHWSPAEHPACAGKGGEPSGNFTGWLQFRKEFPNEFGRKR